MRAWCFGSVLLLTLTGAVQAAPPAPPPAPQPPAEGPRARIWREPPGPVQDGRLGMPVAGNLQVGVGRFSVLEPARLRTHTEPHSRTADVARRNRGIAAVGLSLRF